MKTKALQLFAELLGDQVNIIPSENPNQILFTSSLVGEEELSGLLVFEENGEVNEYCLGYKETFASYEEYETSLRKSVSEMKP